MQSKIYKILLSFLFILHTLSGFSQFYNGHQMTFGKNRVQFEKFEWYYYRFEKFDVYYYLGSSDVALRTAEIANKAIPDIEKRFEHQLNNRLIFIVYQNLTDFRQSNIGLNTGDEQYNIGGVLKVIDNIAFLYGEGDYTSLNMQIYESVSNIILNNMIFGDNFRNKLANNTIINTPEWYIKGLSEYISREWNSELENETKNGILSKRFKDFNQLTDYDAIIAGASIWNFIAKTYGKEVIPNIVYLTRMTKNIESGFLYILGLSLNDLQANWQNYYQNQYSTFDAISESPEGTNIIKKSRKNVEYYQLKYSPVSQKFAWSENKQGKYWIKIKDPKTNKTKTIYKREHKLKQITDYSYPVINWHPSGEILGFIIEKKGKTYFVSYSLETKKNINEIEIASLEKVTSFDYSNDGLFLVFSAFNNGQSDIFLFNIAANTIVNLTYDIADDYNPKFINNAKDIIFSSKREAEEIGNKNNNIIKTQKYNDVFIYNFNSKTIKQITNSDNIQENIPFFNNGNYLFLSDENGINNLYSAKTDSAINFVDTIVHYRYFLEQQQLTNYRYNILDANFNKYSPENTVLYKEKGKYKLLYNEDLPAPILQVAKTTSRTVFENELRKATEIKNTKLQNIEIPQEKENTDISNQTVDINNYVFDKDLPFMKKEKNEKNEEFDEHGRVKSRKTDKYFTTFYTNYLVTKIDFGFLTNSYQTFTGSAFYFNPGLNVILKVETADLFEDYRITAGARLSANFDSNEYLLSFENLKKRWNKQLVLHRQAIMNTVGNRYFLKTFNHEAFYIMRYPFSQVFAMQYTANLRQNNNVYLSIDNPSLLEPNFKEYWASLKAELIFDNTNSIITNILSGTRFKLFGEAFKQIDKKETDMFVVGADFRYYQPIHKNIIFASRFASSYSFGKAKLIYYLGGIDNWINFSSKIPTFDSDIKIDPNVNYVYQAVATNLRGFSQNIRNGTNFAVINTEIRFPIISYFYTRPINNDFLRCFQLIGFFDVGSAWSGISPFDKNNAYLDNHYDYNSILIIIKNDNYPIVAGYGFGVRTKFLGYFLRFDWAWGIDDNVILPRMYYLSLGLDF